MFVPAFGSHIHRKHGVSPQLIMTGVGTGFAGTECRPAVAKACDDPWGRQQSQILSLAGRDDVGSGNA
jgi:hypothetical protein